MTMGGWTLHRASALDSPVLDDTAASEHARAVAGEASAVWTLDRRRILDACAAEVEAYTDSIWYRGDDGAARVSSAIIETDEPYSDVPIVPERPASRSVTRGDVDLWDEAASMWSTAVAGAHFVLRPGDVLRFEEPGIYRIQATAAPEINGEPAAIREAVARVFAYREHYRPWRRSMEAWSTGGRVAGLQGALLRSGAAEILRAYRRISV